MIARNRCAPWLAIVGLTLTLVTIGRVQAQPTPEPTPAPVLPTPTPAPPTPAPPLADPAPTLDPTLVAPALDEPVPLDPIPAELPPEPVEDAPLLPQVGRQLAGSIQLDYLAAPMAEADQDRALQGTTVELSAKLTVDFGDRLSASVKVCYACHGFEAGMAFFELRPSETVSVKFGRFSPAFGQFPTRHDPANHATSDKPLPYDMGRMLRLREWNQGILPAPWVDNGVELALHHVLSDRVQLDVAAYAIGGPKGASDAVDFDYKLSRSPDRYYVDNNREPSVGGRALASIDVTSRAIVTVGGSFMAGRYDPDADLGFWIAGADATLQVGRWFLRAEALRRRTQIALGETPELKFKYGAGPDGTFADFVLRDGFLLESEWRTPLGEFVLRLDGLRHQGNVLNTSTLRADSAVVRSTAAAAFKLWGPLRFKTSVEFYDFSDFADELALHAGIAGPF